MPLSVLFFIVVSLRRLLYRWNILQVHRFKPVVIVVGNLTVGGTGKSPMVAYLAKLLMLRGCRVGLVSRGYRGRASSWPQVVTAQSDPDAVGDEAVMLVQQTGCPMVVGPDRVAAVSRLLELSELDCVISDDGLQHYALGRDIEVVMIDAKRRLGNGQLLPAGPLREPVSRLKRATFVVSHGAEESEFPYVMQLLPVSVVNALTGVTRSLRDFRGQMVSAVAGIGHPARFFELLRNHGVVMKKCVFADHHRYEAGDFDSIEDSDCVLLTSKDAVKCAGMVDERFWIVSVEARLNDAFDVDFLSRFDRLAS